LQRLKVKTRLGDLELKLGVRDKVGLGLGPRNWVEFRSASGRQTIHLKKRIEYTFF
jgi:hypothetical protein